MKKKIFMVLILIISINSGIFAQQTERLTFTEISSDGTIIGTVTVNAAFAGFLQKWVSIENNMQVVRESAYTNANGVWSDWGPKKKEPAILPTIRQIFDSILRDYHRYPRGAVRWYLKGIPFVNIMTIPDGRISPLWWNDDGKSFFIMYEVWAIKL